MKISFVMLAMLGMFLACTEAASISRSDVEDTLVNLLLRELLDEKVG